MALRITLFAALLAALAGHAVAQHQHGAPAPTASPSTRAFQEANARMHRDMAIAYTGRADIDFLRGMIPHHQGAIDMARVVLEHGQDPEVKALATEIVRAQEAEIAHMRRMIQRLQP